jgi:hypothetical protein
MNLHALLAKTDEEYYVFQGSNDDGEAMVWFMVTTPAHANHDIDNVTETLESYTGVYNLRHYKINEAWIESAEQLIDNIRTDYGDRS